MDTALPPKFPFILDRNLAKANCTENHVCTSRDTVVLAVALMAIFGCSPDSADSDECEVKAGDLLLVATDGVFDNLPVSSILRYLQPVRDSSDLSDLQAAANSIAKEAREHAFDERYMSPFAVNARMAGINAIGKGVTLLSYYV